MINIRGKYDIVILFMDYDQFQESFYVELLQDRVEEVSDFFFFYFDDELGLAVSIKLIKFKYESKEGDGYGDVDVVLFFIMINGGKVVGESFFVFWVLGVDVKVFD